jgi:hypothetical protein
MNFKADDWLYEGQHPKLDEEVIEMLDAGKLLTYKLLRTGEDWNTYEGEYPMWIAEADDTVFWIRRTNQEGAGSFEGHMMFSRTFGHSDFIDVLELIAPLKQWTTAIRKGIP